MRDCPFFIPLSQDPLHSVLVEGKNFLLDKKQLQPNVCYTAHVKAKLCPGELYEGPWSEWSSTAEWRTEGGAEKETIGRNTFYPPQVSLLILDPSFRLSRNRKCEVLFIVTSLYISICFCCHRTCAFTLHRPVSYVCHGYGGPGYKTVSTATRSTASIVQTVYM